MAGSSSWEDLDLTKEEFSRLSEAMKTEEFRKLLAEYADEVNDPENKKLYQKEMTELEKERGVDITFIEPEPGYVIKTSIDGQKKAFVNVCKNCLVGKPSSNREVQDGARGLNWSLPYTQAPPREDLDKDGNRCTVFDVIFHPSTHRLAETNASFKKMLDSTALEAVENNFDVKLDRKNIKFPKLKFKGIARAAVIRKKVSDPPPKEEDDCGFSFPYPPHVEQNEQARRASTSKSKSKTTQAKIPDDPSSPYTTPKYLIKYRSDIDIQDFATDRTAKMNAAIPKSLVIEINLPLLKAATEVTLDVTEKSLSLMSEKPAKYKLDLPLPYCVVEDGGSAKFDKIKKTLVITLPVKRPPETALFEINREDSGVESDLGCRTPESGGSGDDDFGVKDLITGSVNSHPAASVATRMDSVSSIGSDEGYRTNVESDVGSFLNPDTHYCFPNHACNVLGNTVAFVLNVKNVDPSSVKHCLIDNGVHVMFTSVGAGFFPISYAFCVKFPSTLLKTEDEVIVETWDNNVIVQIQISSCDRNTSEYFAGVDKAHLEKYELPTISSVGDKLKDIQLETLSDVEEEDGISVEVSRMGDDEVVVNISRNQEEPEDNKLTVVELVAEEEEMGKSVCDRVDLGKSSRESTPVSLDEPELQKRRSASECSMDDMGSGFSKKGILKCRRVCRSLSESSADDYALSSSLDLQGYSGSDSCIPEEGEESHGAKKTVRFSDKVAEKTYRLNSSILGQRKKNQKKSQLKKRAQERRVSESENSEGEADRDKEKKHEVSKSGSEPVACISGKGKKKKRDQDWRVSESENSEGEVEKEREKTKSGSELAPVVSGTKGKKKKKHGQERKFTESENSEGEGEHERGKTINETATSEPSAFEAIVKDDDQKREISEDKDFEEESPQEIKRSLTTEVKGVKKVEGRQKSVVTEPSVGVGGPVTPGKAHRLTDKQFNIPEQRAGPSGMHSRRSLKKVADNFPFSNDLVFEIDM